MNGVGSYEMDDLGRQDGPNVVLDEVSGIWEPLVRLPLCAWHMVDPALLVLHAPHIMVSLAGQDQAHSTRCGPPLDRRPPLMGRSAAPPCR